LTAPGRSGAARPAAWAA